MAILVLCQRGNVRSVTVATILKDYIGTHDVLAAGIQTTLQATMDMLTEWADIVLIAGTVEHNEDYFKQRAKVYHILSEIGQDVWGQAMHPELVRLSLTALERVNLSIDLSLNYGPVENYLRAVDAKFNSLMAVK